MLIEVLCHNPAELDLLIDGKNVEPIYRKVNKKPVEKLSFVGIPRGKRVSVVWVDGGIRHVRLYNDPKVLTTFNKNHTKIRMEIQGQYEQEFLDEMPTKTELTDTEAVVRRYKLAKAGKLDKRSTRKPLVPGSVIRKAVRRWAATDKAKEFLGE